MDEMVDTYENVISRLLNKHAPAVQPGLVVRSEVVRTVLDDLYTSIASE